DDAHCNAAEIWGHQRVELARRGIVGDPIGQRDPTGERDQGDDAEKRAEPCGHQADGLTAQSRTRRSLSPTRLVVCPPSADQTTVLRFRAATGPSLAGYMAAICSTLGKAPCSSGLSSGLRRFARPTATKGSRRMTTWGRSLTMEP